jgi:hypothetical protein
MKKILASVGVLALATVAHAQLAIERLAPKDTFVFVGLRDATRTIEHAKASSLWELWHSDEMQQLMKEALEEFSTGMEEMFAELDIQDGQLLPPTGAAGFAMFLTMDEDLGVSKPALLAFADYGDNADKTAEIITAALNKARDEQQAEIDEQELLGKTVYTVTFKDDQPEPENEPAPEDGMDDDLPMEFEEPPSPIDLKTLHYVRSGNVFVASTKLDALSDAMEVIDGGESPGAAEHEEFKTAMAQIGTTEVYSVLLTSGIGRMLQSDPNMMMVNMMLPMLEPVFGRIASASVGVNFGTPGVIMDQKFAVAMPDGKKGVWKLFNDPEARGEVPSFVSADAVSFSRINLQFSGIMDLVRTVVRTNPMLQGEVDPFLMEYGPKLESLFGALGNKMYVVSNLTRPIQLSSKSSVIVVECRDQAAFENVIQEFAPEMGFEPRDFLGHRIYTGEGPGMMMMEGMPPDMQGETPKTSIGIGGGFVVIGENSSVENMMRTVGQAGRSALADEDLFARAVAALPEQPSVAWGYLNVVDQMEYTQIAAVEQQKQMLAQMREWDPEFAAEMEKDMQEQSEMLQKLSPELLRRYLGPAAWQIFPTEEGYAGSYFWLEPVK